MQHLLYKPEIDRRFGASSSAVQTTKLKSKTFYLEVEKHSNKSNIVIVTVNLQQWQFSNVSC